jgi:hypothetical protein
MLGGDIDFVYTLSVEANLLIQINFSTSEIDVSPLGFSHLANV